MTFALPKLGSTKDDLDTPALCLDLDKFDANIARVVATCRRQGIAWRPHAKCHKSVAIARRLVAAGAIGMTCAKLGEAEVFAAAGIRDLLIANLIASPNKLRRLAHLRRIADPIVCVDHSDHVAALVSAMSGQPAPVRVLVEVNIGLDRVGVTPGDDALNLARQVAEAPGVQLAGLMGYEGHLLQIPDPTEKASRIQEAIRQLTDTAQRIRESGLECPIVSCGGTGSYATTVQCPGITEIQAGGLIFMDEFYRQRCQVTNFDFAMTVVATIVSRPVPERAIIDAGRKAMNIELVSPTVVGRPDIEVSRLSAEHGQLRLSGTATGLRIGDRLEFIPGYGDLTTVLHDRFYGFRDGKLVDIWPLEARGRLD